MADENTAGGDAAPTGTETEAKPALQPDPASTDTPEADPPAGDTEATTGQDDPKTDDDAGDPEGERPQPKRKGGFQRRIERLEAERDFAMDALLRQRGQQQAPAAPAQRDADGEPDAGDAAKYPLGSFDPKYHADVARYEVRKELMKAEEQARRDHVVGELQSKAAAFRARGADVAKGYGPDFSEALADLLAPDPDTPIKISAPMTAVLLEADRGPEVAVWLYKHPDEAARIYRMPDVLAARELGRIEAKLPDPPARRTTAAPSPPKEVQGGNSKVSAYDPHRDDSEGEESYERWKAWRRKQG